MGEVFKGSQRKLGLVTVVMSLCFMAGWVRSKQRCDFVEVNGKSWRFGVESILENLRFIQTNPLENSRIFNVNSSELKHMGNVTVKSDGRYELIPVVGERAWRFEWYGFHVSHGSSPPRVTYHSVLVVPYGSIVVPLTALSILLLVKKPKTSTPK